MMRTPKRLRFLHSTASLPARPTAVRRATPSLLRQGTPMARSCPLSVISDCHLGTSVARAEALLAYLQSITPGVLVINGDLCDLGTWFQRCWPPAHLAIFARILDLAKIGCEVVYIIGNHDEALRRMPSLEVPGIRICDHEIREIGGQRILITHGDCLDHDLGADRLIHRMAAVGYRRLMHLDGQHQRVRRWCRLSTSERSLATAIKRRVPGSAAYIARFEAAALSLAADANCHGVICGHIHQPALRRTVIDGRPMLYLNSGDWVEHCTALEYDLSGWHLVTTRTASLEHPGLPAVATSSEPDVLAATIGAV